MCQVNVGQGYFDSCNDEFREIDDNWNAAHHSISLWNEL